MKFLPGILSVVSILNFNLARAAPASREPTLGGVYFITNTHDQENRVVIHSVLSDGTLEFSKTVTTGGVGASYQNSTVNGPDGLHSQGSVVVFGSRLLAVNAGSNSLSVFDINPNDPTDLRLIGNPISSGGDFPTSIATSSKTGSVCVLNGGVRNGVQCFKSTSQGLSPIPNGNRPLKLAEINPPAFGGDAFGVSQVIFSQDESKLIVSVRGSADGSPGFLAVWNVNKDGSLAESHDVFPAPTRAGQQNFGIVALQGTDGYAVADPSQGAVLYDLSDGFGRETAVSKNLVIEGQSAICWVTFASKSNTYFFTDAATQILFEYSFESNLEGTQVAQHVLPSGASAVDAIVGTFGNDQFLFQIAPGLGSVFVLKVATEGKSKVIQQTVFTSDLQSNGVNIHTTSQGMAVFVKQ